MKYDEDELMLIDMICETNDEVRNSLYEKYEPTIKAVVRKYARTAQKLGLDQNDLLQEANVGFTDALNHFDASKEASLKTFISVCIERRLIKFIEKNRTLKSKLIQDSLSLDYDYNEQGLPLKEIIGDDKMDPSKAFTDQENYKHILNQIKDKLSSFEYEVFLYMLNGLGYQKIAELLDKSPKQIDNTIQRIRNKIRNLFKNEEE